MSIDVSFVKFAAIPADNAVFTAVTICASVRVDVQGPETAEKYAVPVTVRDVKRVAGHSQSWLIVDASFEPVQLQARGPQPTRGLRSLGPGTSPQPRQ